ncbi:MAG: carbohydrate ABC transporter permease [Clostridiales bacterium]|nr:carbohydrate ABC transporter permease [Clostridiales bacterium]
MTKRFKNKPTGLLSFSDLKTPKGKIVYWLFFALLLIACLVAVIPAIWTILTAFKDTQEIYSEFTFLPKNMSWGRIVTRLSESWAALQLGGSVFNTIILSVGNLVMTVIVCGIGGYVLSKLKPKGYKLIFTLVVWTMMMPGQMRLVPCYISYLHFPFAYDIGGVSLLDTYWPMWLGAAANAFNVILFKNSFDGLSQSYVDAAKIDGCGDVGTFFKIMLPLAMPIVIFVSIGALSGAWAEFFTPMLVLDKNTVLPVKIYRLAGDTSIKMNTYFMALVFSCVPTFLIFLIFQRHILGGVNIGGVKG